MSFQQLAAQLRLIRSQMPRVTSERAYAQMDRKRHGQSHMKLLAA